MAWALRDWVTIIVLFFAAISPAAAEPKRVLLLHSFGPQFVPWVFFAGQFREELFKQSPYKINFYEASLEGARFQQADEQRPTIDYLVALFGSKKLDLIVTLGAPAVIFVQKYRAEFFPSTPLLIGMPEQRTIDRAALTSNDAPVAAVLDFTQWIESVLQFSRIRPILSGLPVPLPWTDSGRRNSVVPRNPSRTEYRSSGSMISPLRICWNGLRSCHRTQPHSSRTFVSTQPAFLSIESRCFPSFGQLRTLLSSATSTTTSGKASLAGL